MVKTILTCITVFILGGTAAGDIARYDSLYFDRDGNDMILNSTISNPWLMHFNKVLDQVNGYTLKGVITDAYIPAGAVEGGCFVSAGGDTGEYAPISILLYRNGVPVAAQDFPDRVTKLWNPVFLTLALNIAEAFVPGDSVALQIKPTYPLDGDAVRYLVLPGLPDPFTREYQILYWENEPAAVRDALHMPDRRDAGVLGTAVVYDVQGRCWPPDAVLPQGIYLVVNRNGVRKVLR